MSLAKSLIVSISLAGLFSGPALAQDGGMKKWVQGKGWGWVWGQEDEIGALNEMTDASRLAALQLVKQGKTYDLGLPYDRMSYKWPGHSPGEVISFRSPAGVRTQKDLSFATPEGGNTGGTAWHSNAIFMNDNVATQIDGLGHITHGPDSHFYNGFKAAEWGGDFGLRKTDVTTIPPVVARGVLIDVAGYKKVDALPSHYEISIEDLEGALRAQNVEVTPGSVVLVRTGTARYWGGKWERPYQNRRTRLLWNRSEGCQVAGRAKRRLDARVRHFRSRVCSSQARGLPGHGRQLQSRSRLSAG